MKEFKGSSNYVVSADLLRIVNIAIALEKPLLIKGEPGTGKTQLAQAISDALDKELIIWNIKSTTKAQDGLYVYDTVQRLYDTLPYIDSVTVKKRFPTTLRLVITETAPAAVIATEDESSWWLMDGKGKILEQIDAATAENYTRILGLYAVSPQISKPVDVGEGHISQLNGLLGLLQVLQERGMTSQINSINASSRTELVMVYQGRIQAKLLNNVDFNRKILILEEIVAVLGDEEQGVLDMKTEKNFYSPF